MKQYAYTLEHSIGRASGTIEAASKSEAKRKLSMQYEVDHIDDKGKKKKIVITSLVLNEVGE